MGPTPEVQSNATFHSGTDLALVNQPSQGGVHAGEGIRKVGKVEPPDLHQFLYLYSRQLTWSIVIEGGIQCVLHGIR